MLKKFILEPEQKVFSIAKKMLISEDSQITIFVIDFDCPSWMELAILRFFGQFLIYLISC
jgi:hypothetical protein